MQKKHNSLKKLKIEIIKKRKEKKQVKKEKREKKENTELQKLNVEAEAYNNNKKYH